MTNSLQKFQDLLRDLFQFDSADLDFGIYRIMNHKRDVIERFIWEDSHERTSFFLSGTVGMITESCGGVRLRNFLFWF